jgi:hypothetical protein
MKRIEVESEEAGAKIIFEFVDDNVQPTEALAAAFAQAIFKLIKENPWKNAPATEIALAWSLASVVAHAADLTDTPKEFVENVIGTLQNFYNPQ